MSDAILLIRRLAFSPLGLIAVLLAAWPAALAAYAYAPPRAPATEQTHPDVRPHTGGPHTTFVLTLTAGDDLGVHGVVRTDYAIRASTGRTGCHDAFAANLTAARKGQRLSLALRPQRTGWCRGRYAGTVLLVRGPYCPKPGPGQPPRPCPEFASQALDAGRFAFRVG